MPGGPDPLAAACEALASPCIYTGSPPRLRPHRRLLPRIVSGSSFAISFEYDDDPGLYALGILAILRMVCGSCGAPAAHANALARRAFLSSSLRCRQPPVGSSGAGLSVSLFPPLTFSRVQVDWNMS